MIGPNTKSRVRQDVPYRNLRNILINTTSITSLVQEARSISEWIVDIRRRLHQCPELLYELHETSQIVAGVLDSLHIPYRSRVAQTGIVATIGTGEGPCILLRADMDALEIEEQTDVPFASRNKGYMHACGHDCHTAMLLGAARLLKAREQELNGTVKLCFQPAEEGGAGAQRMCQEGVMDDPKVSRAFGVHMWPQIPTGTLSGRAGVILASTSKFEILIQGKGGHAAMPHLCADPLVAAAQLIQAAQALIARQKSPFAPAVISFTGLKTPSKHGIIPDHALIMGTVRALESNLRNELKQRLMEVADHTARCNDCSVAFETIGIEYPETRNNAKLWDMVREIGASIVGRENVLTAEPLLAGEDFSFYGAHADSCFINVGCRNEVEGCIHGLHSPLFKVDEAALPYGTAMHTAFAMQSLVMDREQVA